MEHYHISPNNPKWDRHKYICECGFETGDRAKFDKHIQKNITKDAADGSIAGDEKTFNNGEGW